MQNVSDQKLHLTCESPIKSIGRLVQISSKSVEIPAVAGDLNEALPWSEIFIARLSNNNSYLANGSIFLYSVQGDFIENLMAFSKIYNTLTFEIHK